MERERARDIQTICEPTDLLSVYDLLYEYSFLRSSVIHGDEAVLHGPAVSS